MQNAKERRRYVDRGLPCRPFFLLAFLVSLILFALSSPVLGEDWKLENSREGIDVYLREINDSPIPEFKAVTRMDGTVASVLAVLLDISRYPEWIHRCRVAIHLGADGPRRQYLYQLNSLPFARDRDIILRATLSHQDRGRNVRIDLEAAPEYCNTDDREACGQIDEGRHVRIQQAPGSYRLRQLEPEVVEVVWQQHLDPGGRLPGWLVRSQLADIPLKTLTALRQRIKKPEYQQADLRISGEALHIVKGNEAAPADEMSVHARM